MATERTAQLLAGLEGLIATLGITVEVVDDRLVLRMTLDDRHKGAPGVCHGGATAALLDTALGACAMSHALDRGMATSTVEMKVNFLRPGVLGSTLRAEASLQAAGRTLLVVSGAAFDEATGDKVGFATGTFNLYPLDAMGLRSD